MKILIFLIFSTLLSSCYSFSMTKYEDGIKFSYDASEENSSYVQNRIKYYSQKKCGKDNYIQFRKEIEKDFFDSANYRMQKSMNIMGAGLRGEDTNKLAREYKFAETFTPRKTYLVPITITLCTNEINTFKLLQSSKSELLDIEKEVLWTNYVKCYASFLSLDEKQKSCVNVLSILYNSYYKKNLTPNNVELLILGNTSYNFCYIDPTNCYVVKQYLKYRDNNIQIKKPLSKSYIDDEEDEEY